MKTSNYKKYKDTGIEWLGEIPSEWDVAPLAKFFSVSKTKIPEGSVPPLSVGYMGAVPQLNEVSLNTTGADRKLVRKGNIVINSRSDRMGAVGLSENEGGVSVVYHVLEPKIDLVGKYFHHLMRSRVFSQEFYRQGSGIVDDLWSTKDIKLTKIRVPEIPIDDQKRIAEYLDNKCLQIDSLIGQGRQNLSKNPELFRQVHLLREYKFSLIYNVTTGKIKI